MKIISAKLDKTCRRHAEKAISCTLGPLKIQKHWILAPPLLKRVAGPDKGAGPHQVAIFLSFESDVDIVYTERT